MIYALTLIYLAVIVYLEISHKIERQRYYTLQKPKEEKHRAAMHFSPHRSAIKNFRSDKE